MFLNIFMKTQMLRERRCWELQHEFWQNPSFNWPQPQLCHCNKSMWIPNFCNHKYLIQITNTNIKYKHQIQIGNTNRKYKYKIRNTFCIFGGTHLVEMGSPFVDSVTRFVVLEQPDGKFDILGWQKFRHRPECWFLNRLETTKLVIFKSRNN